MVMMRRHRLSALMLLIALAAFGLAGYRAVRDGGSFVNVQGLVKNPSLIPITGQETVLDVLNASGGILASLDIVKVRVVRANRGWTPGSRSLPVDLKGIVLKGQATTNYRLEPGDRLQVY